MLEVYRCRQIEWSPSGVVAIATSVNGAAVAVARDNGAIEIWSVAAGSLGWHCQLTIPGREGAAISSLAWCQSSEEKASTLGRLFSSGLDGNVTEWDLQTLQPRAVVSSMGGSVWQMAAEHVAAPKDVSGSSSRRGSEENESDDEESSSSNDSDDDEPERKPQRVALACEDGVARIFEVAGSKDGLVYQKSFPRVKGRILSVAWTWDGGRLVVGDSVGCIRCWDIANTREIYRITAGIGVHAKTKELCIWSLLVLRNGDIVSGDSSGSTQFWDGQMGTLLQAHTRHEADVLALAAAHDQDVVFAAGGDGQVIQFQSINESRRVEADEDDIVRGSSAGKWIYIGHKRVHTHDVRALAIATPIVAPPIGMPKGTKKERKRTRKAPRISSKEWALPRAEMLISGGNDAKLFAYSAEGFLNFHPHDICPCPERPFIQLANQGAATLLMVQHSTKVEVWKIQGTFKNHSARENGHSVLGKRKWEGDSDDESMPMSNGHSKALVVHSNGHARTPWKVPNLEGPGISTPSAPLKLATIKTSSSEHIVCSAISGEGRLVAFADSQRPRLYELEPSDMGGAINIRKRKLPAAVRAAYCMVFSVDSSRLIVAGPHGVIWVVDTKRSLLVHTFEPVSRAMDRYVPSHNDLGWGNGIVKIMCTSSDGQWLAAASSSGFIAVFNLEVLRHHWTVPMLDGNAATAMLFHPELNNVLIVSSAANQIHVLDVEVKAPGEWSRRNSAQIANKMQEFPGTVIGLSLPSTPSSASLIAYSSRAMCRIDLTRSIGDDVVEPVKEPVEESVKEPVEESVKEPVEEPVKEPVEESVKEPVEESVKEPVEESVKEPVEESVKEPVEESVKEPVAENVKEPVAEPVANGEAHVGANGNGNGKVHGNGGAIVVVKKTRSKWKARKNSEPWKGKSMVAVNLRDPVLFLGHTGPNSLVIVEKPWSEVLRKFHAPVARHLYGT